MILEVGIGLGQIVMNKKKEILIISQGSEYVVVDEEVTYKLEEND
ncbi:MAG: hypothetical protein ACJ0GH_01460 [Alphaproteobacteria bacterium]